MTDKEVEAVVAEEMTVVTGLELRSRLERMLVAPKRLRLLWDYGSQSETKDCWAIAQSADSASQVVFCPEGFGEDRWGVVELGADSMGNDGHWFPRLCDAVIAAGWIPAPRGYEVP